MKILILGGTRFLGRHLVTAALARNHQITLFNRGTKPSADFEDLEIIKGDRNTDLQRLQGRRWDAVIDTSGYLPRTVKASAQALEQSLDRYVFISSISVYADLKEYGVDETAPVARISSEELERANAIDVSGQTSAVTYGPMYGGLKALCEQAVEEALPGRELIIRPGLIIGPYDYSDRFTYWISRVARGGEVLAPGRPNRCIQFVDCRDLAEWTISMIERQETGVYNANGMAGTMTMKGTLEECKLASNSDASFTWVDDEFLIEEKVAPWSEMPFWMPQSAALEGFMFINCDKAVAAGLTFRSLNDSVRDILAWRAVDPAAGELKAGIDADREKRLLRKWHTSREA